MISSVKVLLLFCFALFTASPAALAQSEVEVPFQILGVIATGTADGIAVIKYLPTQRTFVARQGLEIDDQHRVLRITSRYVYLRVKRKIIRIRIGESAGYFADGTRYESVVKIAEGIEKKGDEIRMTTALRDQLIERDLATVLLQAAAIPYFREGGLIGFKLLDIDRDSVYEKAGLRDGDIVTALNGTHLSDVGTAVHVLNKLRTEDRIDISIERQKAPQTIRLRIQ